MLSALCFFIEVLQYFIFLQICKIRCKRKIAADVEARANANYAWWQNERLRGFYRERIGRQNARELREQQQREQHLRQQEQATARVNRQVHPMAEVQTDRPGAMFKYFDL